MISYKLIRYRKDGRIWTSKDFKSGELVRAHRTALRSKRVCELWRLVDGEFSNLIYTSLKEVE